METISHESLYLFKYLGLFILGIFLIPTTWKYLTDEQSDLLSEADELMSSFWSMETVARNLRTTEEKSKFNQANRIYQSLINTNPRMWQAHFALGRSQRAFGYYLEAQKSLAHAYEIMPERVEVVVEYTQASLEANHLSVAYEVLKPNIKSFPDNSLLKKQLVIFLLLSNQPELTLKQLDIFKSTREGENETMQLYRLLAERLKDKKILPPSNISQLYKMIESQGEFGGNSILSP